MAEAASTRSRRTSRSSATTCPAARMPRTTRRRNGSRRSAAMHLFDKGWNELREQIFANQKKLGVIPQDAKLTPWPKDCSRSGTSSRADEKKMFIRQAEVYAAYLAYTDHEIGRVIQASRTWASSTTRSSSTSVATMAPAPKERRSARPTRSLSFNGVDVPVEAAAQVFLRRLGHRPDLPAHGRRLDLGLRHAVQVDQADRVALRRHAAGYVHRLAEPHQGQGRHPSPVPSRHRHRADDPGSHRHPGAGDGQRHRAEADRRREHGLHLRQGQRQGARRGTKPSISR